MRTDDSDAPTVLRIRDLHDLVHLVPTLLGFHPRDSLVVVIVADGRVRVTARVDLDAVGEEAALERALAPLWAGAEPMFCFAVAFGETDAGCGALDAVGRLVPPGWRLEVALVDGDRWCDPWHGDWHPYDPAASRVTAEAVYHGRALLPDRAALAAGLGDGGGAEAVPAIEGLIGRPPEELVRAALVLWAGLRAEPRPLLVDEAALLAVAAHAPALAGQVLAGLDRRSAEDERALWTQVVRAVPLAVGLAATGLVGVAAWLDGDGALANVCLERAAPWADGCPWYGFLDTVTRRGVHPDDWAAVRGQLWVARVA